jgi:hypothetical protein
MLLPVNSPSVAIKRRGHSSHVITTNMSAGSAGRIVIPER